MNIHTLYFSPTGGTKKVMDILTAELGAAESIDLSLSKGEYENYQFGETDLCLVGVPSFGGRVPETALSALKRMRVAGASAILVAVYGNRAYDDTLLELKNELKSCGFKTQAAIAAVAEHSIMHQFGAGRPDHQDHQELVQFAATLKDRITAKSFSDDINVPGSKPYREYNGVPFKPSAGKHCTGCGLCADACPVGAISVAHPSSVDEKLCISCMRCVGLCPNHARDLNKVVLAVAAQKMKSACSTRKENELFI